MMNKTFRAKALQVNQENRLLSVWSYAVLSKWQWKPVYNTYWI